MPQINWTPEEIEFCHAHEQYVAEMHNADGPSDATTERLEAAARAVKEEHQR